MSRVAGTPAGWSGAVFVALCAALAGCSSVEVHHDFDVEADFASYRTYAWLPPAPVGADSAVGLAGSAALRLRAAVDAQMRSHGVSQDANDPDLRVSCRVEVGDRVSVTDWGYEYGGDYRDWATRDVGLYRESRRTLIVDLVDARTRRLVWRGTAVAPARARESWLDDAAARIFEDYPPRRR